MRDASAARVMSGASGGVLLKFVACVAVALAVLAPAAAWSHEIPASIVIRAFLRPQGHQLRLLVRVPVAAMRDVEFPLKPGGLLDIPRAGPSLHDAATLWLAKDIALYEGDTPLGAPRLVAARVSLPSDRSFITYETAMAHVTASGPDADVTLPWDQAMLDVLLEYRITSDRATFSIHPALARLGVRVVTVLRYQPPAGAERAFEYTGDPGLVRLDPRWYQAASRFVGLGFAHILDGTDHLLFLFCLVIPFRRFRALVLIVTAFTLAHSLTLAASAAGIAPAALWFPPLIETLIAGSILYMALENIAGSMSVQRRWLIAFSFGLVHGFGFSFALRDTLQFAGAHLVTALFAFNIGVELGQLFVLALMVPALQLLYRFVVSPRLGTVLLSALAAHTAWHWSGERWERLRQFEWPSVTPVPAVELIQWLMLAVIAAALAWMIATVTARKREAPAVNYRPNPAPAADQGEPSRS